MTTPMTLERLALFSESPPSPDDVDDLIGVTRAALAVAGRSPVYEDYDDESDTLSGVCTSCGAGGSGPCDYNEETEENDPVKVRHFAACDWSRLVEAVTCEPRPPAMWEE